MKTILILFALFVFGSAQAQTSPNILPTTRGGTGLKATTRAALKDSLTVPDTSITNAATGAITIGSAYRQTFVTTYNGGAGSYTIAAPSGATDNFKEITIIQLAAQTDTITCTSEGFNAKGSTGTVVFTAAIGNSVTLLAYAKHWFVKTKTNGTVN